MVQKFNLRYSRTCHKIITALADIVVMYVYKLIGANISMQQKKKKSMYKEPRMKKQPQTAESAYQRKGYNRATWKYTI